MLGLLAALTVCPCSERGPGASGDAATDMALYVSPVDAAGKPTHVVVRVVDRVTGRPLPGATVSLHAQREHPKTGLVPAARVGIADAEGWVRIRAIEMGDPDWSSFYWLYTEAPGFAGAALGPGVCLLPGQEIPLTRAQHVVVEVRDALDRPVRGATIGTRVSSTCGHMNDQRVSVSGEDGRAIVRDVCSDLEADEYVNPGWECWVVAEGIESTYHDLRVQRERRGPQILRHLPSRPVVGAIKDHAGRPLAGIAVGVLGGFHRGPWTWTDHAGRFKLVGARLGQRITAVQRYPGMYRKDAPMSPSFEAPPPGVARVFTMPKPGDPMESPAMTWPEIVARDDASGEVAEDAPLVAWRDGDGWTTRGFGTLPALPVGTFTIQAGGGVSGYAAVRARMEIPDLDAEPPALVLRVKQHPPVRVDLVDDPELVEIRLVSADAVRSRGVLEAVAAGQLPVPPGVSCALHVEARTEVGRILEHVPIPPDAHDAGAPPVRIHATRTARVRAHLKGPDGVDASGWLVPRDEWLLARDEAEWETEATADARPMVRIPMEGSVHLLAVPEGRALAPQWIVADLPRGARGGSVVDVGTVRLRSRGDASLAVLDAGGKQRTDAWVRVLRNGDLWTVGLWAERGVYDSQLAPLRAGDVVIADATWTPDDVLTRSVRMTLTGAGPWTLRADEGDTALHVHALDEAGSAIQPFLLVLDGQPRCVSEYDHEAGHARIAPLRGLTPGPHVVAIATDQHVTSVHHVVLTAGETHHLNVRLRKRK